MGAAAQQMHNPSPPGHTIHGDVDGTSSGLWHGTGAKRGCHETFEALSEAEKQEILEQTHHVKSKQEMRQLIAGLCNPGGTQA